LNQSLRVKITPKNEAIHLARNDLDTLFNLCKHLYTSYMKSCGVAWSLMRYTYLAMDIAPCAWQLSIYLMYINTFSSFAIAVEDGVGSSKFRLSYSIAPLKSICSSSRFTKA
jgi:hypothetical protein